VPALDRLKFIAPSWDEIHLKVLKLAKVVRESGYKPEIIVGIARGGWIVARLLSDLLDIPDIASIRIEFYKGIAETTRSPVVTQPVSTSVRGKCVLVADDVSDTGSSLTAAVRHLIDEGAAEIRVATIHVKPWTTFVPDYYVAKTDAWIIYPWEPYETIKSLTQKWMEEGLSLEEIRQKLIEVGVKKEFVEEILPLVVEEGSDLVVELESE